MTCGRDGTIKFWHKGTFAPFRTIRYLDAMKAAYEVIIMVSEIDFLRYWKMDSSCWLFLIRQTQNPEHKSWNRGKCMSFQVSYNPNMSCMGIHRRLTCAGGGTITRPTIHPIRPELLSIDESHFLLFLCYWEPSLSSSSPLALVLVSPR